MQTQGTASEDNGDHDDDDNKERYDGRAGEWKIMNW